MDTDVTDTLETMENSTPLHSATRERVLERFGDPQADTPRGDHDLNPGIEPEGELVAAAVLVPLVDRHDGLTVLFTKRTDHLAKHPGQISFPGGHIEDDDADPVATALRETEEETGISPDHVEVIGRMDTYITRTGFTITPVVGIVSPTFKINPDPYEVAEVFEVPLAFLLDPENHQRHVRTFESHSREFHAMPYGDYFIWGATAGMLINLYEFLNRP